MNDPTQSPGGPEDTTGPPAPVTGENVTGDTEVTEKEPEFYCPACGRRYGYLRECSGTPVLPHPPVEVVSTDELDGDPGEHTPAPAGE